MGRMVSQKWREWWECGGHWCCCSTTSGSEGNDDKFSSASSSSSSCVTTTGLAAGVWRPPREQRWKPGMMQGHIVTMMDPLRALGHGSSSMRHTIRVGGISRLLVFLPPPQSFHVLIAAVVSLPFLHKFCTIFTTSATPVAVATALLLPLASPSSPCTCNSFPDEDSSSSSCHQHHTQTPFHRSPSSQTSPHHLSSSSSSQTSAVYASFLPRGPVCLEYEILNHITLVLLSHSRTPPPPRFFFFPVVLSFHITQYTQNCCTR